MFENRQVRRENPNTAPTSIEKETSGVQSTIWGWRNRNKGEQNREKKQQDDMTTMCTSSSPTKSSAFLQNYAAGGQFATNLPAAHPRPPQPHHRLRCATRSRHSRTPWTRGCRRGPIPTPRRTPRCPPGGIGEPQWTFSISGKIAGGGGGTGVGIFPGP